MYTDILILSTLKIRAQHGYEIKRSIEQLLGGIFNITNSQLYPSLKKFVGLGAVQREIVRQEGKPDKHVYHLTNNGHKIMHDIVCDFPVEKAKHDAEFLVRVAFFELIEPKERILILEKRRSMLSKRINYLNQVKNNSSDGKKVPYVGRMVKMREQTFQVEMNWINELMDEQVKLNK
jgi:DNA-binding PadR family transcriptional regulator